MARALLFLAVWVSAPTFAALAVQERTSIDNANAAEAPVADGVKAPGGTIGNAGSPQNGGMGVPQRNAVNAASATAMAYSAFVDAMYANGEITRKDWLRLKMSMTTSMMGEVNKARKNDSPLKSMNELSPSGKAPVATTGPGPVPGDGRVDAQNDAPEAPSRTPAAIVENDPTEVGAGAQILDLQGTGPLVFATTVVPDVAGQKIAAESQSIKFPNDPKKLQMDDGAKAATGRTVGGGEAERGDTSETKHEKAVLLAQKLLQEHQAKMAAKAAAAGKSGAEENPESFRQAHAKAMLSLQGLKKVKRVQGEENKEEDLFTPEQIVAAVSGQVDQRAPATAGITSPWGKETAFAEDNRVSNWGLFFMALLGLFSGLAVAYALFLRPQKALVQLMVPGSGEHFTIRQGSKSGDFILDIMDVRGNLVRTAGMLRPESVARAAVLPPDLAAKLGAKGSFDRFEFTHEGKFVRTDKEEGYQVFPFVLDKAS